MMPPIPIRVDVVTDKDSSVWVKWYDNQPRTHEFHTLKLTDEHGRMLAP